MRCTYLVVVWVFLSLYLIAVSERCINERIVRMSLNLDDAVVEDCFIFDVEDISHFLDVLYRES